MDDLYYILFVTKTQLLVEILTQFETLTSKALKFIAIGYSDDRQNYLCTFLNKGIEIIENDV